MLRALFAIYCLAQATDTSSANYVNSREFNKCDNLTFQENITMSQVIGKKWYVIEIFHHKLINDQGCCPFPREIPLELICCPYINVTYANNDTLTDLKLSWVEENDTNNGTIDYRFKINDEVFPGKWISSGAQNGSLVDKCYKQFKGTVFVRKAVEDHLWLQFCSPNTYLYSVVTAKEKWLDPKVVKSIIKIMDITNLPITLRTQMCESSSSTAQATVWLSVAVTVLCFCLSDSVCKTN